LGAVGQKLGSQPELAIKAIRCTTPAHS
jgi:hypothetical protein